MTLRGFSCILNQDKIYGSASECVGSPFRVSIRIDGLKCHSKRGKKSMIQTIVLPLLFLVASVGGPSTLFGSLRSISGSKEHGKMHHP